MRLFLAFMLCLVWTRCLAAESLAEKAILDEIRKQYCEPHDNAERFIGAAAAASRIAVAAGIGAQAAKIASDCVNKAKSTVKAK